MFLFRVIVSVVLSLLATNVTADQSTTENQLPQISLPEKTVQCLVNNNWDCALDYLIPAFREQGKASNLQYYIGYCFSQKANQAISQQDLRMGSELLQQAVEYVDDTANLYAELGFVHLQLSEYESSYQAFLDASSIAPNHPPYIEMLGKISYLTGDLEKAQQHWQRALELQPGNSALRQRLAQLVTQLSITRAGTTEMDHTFLITFDEGMDRDIFNKVWEILEDARYEFGTQLDLWPRRAISVLLLTRQKFTSITAAPSWSGGIYEGQIKIPIADFDAAHLTDIIYHEYMHALLYDALSARCPWWLNEGLAQFFQPGKQYKKEMLRVADKLLSLNPDINPDQLPGQLKTESQARSAYAISLSAVQHLIDRFTIVALRAILSDMSNGLSFHSALEQNTDYSTKELHLMWQKSSGY